MKRGPMPMIRKIAAALCSMGVLAGCASGIDPDLRGRLGSEFTTSNAALRKSREARPAPDARGIIDYQTYQVVIARDGDTPQSIADRLNLAAGPLARHNGLMPDSALRAGDVVVLPEKLTQSSARQPETDDDVGQIASRALAQLSQSEDQPKPAAKPAAPQTAEVPPVAKPASRPKARPDRGPQPIVHRVAAGETAYTIARAYNVSPKVLGEWNNLDGRLSVREGQRLLIPNIPAAQVDPTPASKPGAGSTTPTPPSAADPLPKTATPDPAPAPAPAQAVPAAPSNAVMQMPLNGNIVRDYIKGKTEGIDISAAAGTPIVAAADGTVAAITQNTQKVPIVVIKHDEKLLTIYANVSDLTVAQGDTVARGAKIGVLGDKAGTVLHFEVREGLNAVDPTPYLTQ